MISFRASQPSRTLGAFPRLCPSNIQQERAWLAKANQQHRTEQDVAMLLNQDQRSTLPACRCCVTVLLVLFVAPLASTDKTGRISGVIFTLGPDRVQVVWPTARVTLKNLATRSEIAVSSDDSAYIPSSM